MELICTACHAPLTAMTAGSTTLKVSCPDCAEELLQVRETLEHLRRVMDRFKKEPDHAEGE